MCHQDEVKSTRFCDTLSTPDPHLDMASYLFPFSSYIPLTVAGLILGGYTTLFLIVKMLPSSKKEAEPVAKSADTGSIPSVEDESFAHFIENEENLQKWIDSAE